MSTEKKTGIIGFEKHLTQPPGQVTSDSFHVRPFDHSQTDEKYWLHIHNAASPKLKNSPPWTRRDFAREFSDLTSNRQSDSRFQPAIWLAEPTSKSTGPVGTISIRPKLCTSDSGVKTGIAVVNWLAVIPAFRRLGIAKLLLATVEAACWQHSVTQIELSTLVSWTPAIAFYESQGFRRR